MHYRQELAVIFETRVDALKRSMFEKVKELLGPELPEGVELVPVAKRTTMSGPRSGAVPARGYFAELRRPGYRSIGIALHNGLIYVSHYGIYSSWAELKTVLQRAAQQLGKRVVRGNTTVAQRQWVKDFLDNIWNRGTVGDFTLTAHDDHSGNRLKHVYVLRNRRVTVSLMVSDGVAMRAYDRAQRPAFESNYTFGYFRKFLSQLDQEEPPRGAFILMGNNSGAWAAAWRALRVVLGGQDLGPDPEPPTWLESVVEWCGGIPGTFWTDRDETIGELLSDYGVVWVRIVSYKSGLHQLDLTSLLVEWRFGGEGFSRGGDAAWQRKLHGEFRVSQSKLRPGIIKELVNAALDGHFAQDQAP